MSVVFAFWILFSLITWTSYSSMIIMFVWYFFGILTGLLFILSFYLTNVFITKEDVSFSKKAILGTLFLPLILLTPTRFNLVNFSNVDCEAVEGKLFTDYYYYFGLFISLWILWIIISKYRKAEKEVKKQILFFGIGVELFLFAFFVTGLLSSLTGEYTSEFYGLFGMVIFMGFLAYLIVKYKAFDIKLLGTQALVIASASLIGALLFYVNDIGGKILIGINLLISLILGWFLIRSVKLEVQRKEELQLMSGKLSEANDQLRKLDNSKSEFISIASHQLRTPLTAIKGFISLLLEGSYGKVDPKQQDVLNKVYTSNERLVNLVEDLLNVSRMESGRMEFKFAPWDVNSICQEVADTFIPRAKDLGLYLEYKKTEEHIPEVMIDGTKVREVVSNMVDNALKYTPKGGVTLKVELGEASRYTPAKNAEVEDKGIAGAVVRVIVADTGIGVPQTELPYLFAKFSRGKDISRLNTGGTGLGLYVGRSMIENNGGRIWAESDGEGQGSRFIIEIPVQQTKELMERWG
jgi:signal transduction histidine kinase